jgi:hypothetical protein
MNSRPTFVSRLFLILAFVCAIFVSGNAQAQARERITTARLIVHRAANFGTFYFLRVEIDGRTLANVARGQRYDGFVPAGDHVLTISSYPNSYDRWPASLHLVMQPGGTYVLTAGWVADRLVLR